MSETRRAGVVTTSAGTPCIGALSHVTGCGAVHRGGALVVESSHGPVSWQAGEWGHMAQHTAPVVSSSCFRAAWHLLNLLASWGPSSFLSSLHLRSVLSGTEHHSFLLTESGTQASSQWGEAASFWAPKAPQDLCVIPCDAAVPVMHVSMDPRGAILLPPRWALLCLSLKVQ